MLSLAGGFGGCRGGGSVSRLTKRWKAHPSSSNFLPLQEDVCFVHFYDVFQKTQYQYHAPLLDTVAETSGAIAHAALSAVEGLASVFMEFKAGYQ